MGSRPTRCLLGQAHELGNPRWEHDDRAVLAAGDVDRNIGVASDTLYLFPDGLQPVSGA
jgi:hypothetical protein